LEQDIFGKNRKSRLEERLRLILADARLAGGGAFRQILRAAGLTRYVVQKKIPAVFEKGPDGFIWEIDLPPETADVFRQVKDSPGVRIRIFPFTFLFEFSVQRVHPQTERLSVRVEWSPSFLIQGALRSYIEEELRQFLYNETMAAYFFVLSGGRDPASYPHLDRKNFPRPLLSKRPEIPAPGKAKFRRILLLPLGADETWLKRMVAPPFSPTGQCFFLIFLDAGTPGEEVSRLGHEKKMGFELLIGVKVSAGGKTEEGYLSFFSTHVPLPGPGFPAGPFSTSYRVRNDGLSVMLGDGEKRMLFHLVSNPVRIIRRNDPFPSLFRSEQIRFYQDQESLAVTSVRLETDLAVNRIYVCEKIENPSAHPDLLKFLKGFFSNGEESVFTIAGKPFYLNAMETDVVDRRTWPLFDTVYARTPARVKMSDLRGMAKNTRKRKVERSKARSSFPNYSRGE